VGGQEEGSLITWHLYEKKKKKEERNSIFLMFSGKLPNTHPLHSMIPKKKISNTSLTPSSCNIFMENKFLPTS
jgi:hypothetical protein